MSEKATGKLAELPISKIKENKVALRAVNRQGQAYLELVESIREKGLLSAITVRPKHVTADGDVVVPGKEREDDIIIYELIDGLHRLAACRDAGLDFINCIVTSMEDGEVMVAQIMANVHRVETRPAEYTKQLIRILAGNQLMTESELAQKLGKSTKWISDRLSLTNIENEQITKLINEGKICLTNAFAMAKLPPDEHADWVDRAQTLSPAEFVPEASARQKQVQEARRQGRAAASQEFMPVPHMQKIAAMKDEHSDHEVRAKLVTKGMPASDAFDLAIAWALHLDPASVTTQKTEFEARKKEKAEKATASKTERAKKRAANAKVQADIADKEAQNIEAEEMGKELPFPKVRAELEESAAEAAAKRKKNADKKKAAEPATVAN